jgi:hypothetical protein
VVERMCDTLARWSASPVAEWFDEHRECSVAVIRLDYTVALTRKTLHSDGRCGSPSSQHGRLVGLVCGSARSSALAQDPWLDQSGSCFTVLTSSCGAQTGATNRA